MILAVSMPAEFMKFLFKVVEKVIDIGIVDLWGGKSKRSKCFENSVKLASHSPDIHFLSFVP